MSETQSFYIPPSSGGSGMVIGDPVTGSTAYRVLLVDSTGDLSDTGIEYTSTNQLIVAGPQIITNSASDIVSFEGYTAGNASYIQLSADDTNTDGGIYYFTAAGGVAHKIAFTGGGGTATIQTGDGTLAFLTDINTALLIDGSNAMAANLDAGSFKVINVDTPTADNDAANKIYVDTFVTGLSPKTAVRVATAAALPVGTYDNGVSGVGATYTVTALGILNVDGVNCVLNDRILVKNQLSGLENGIYLLTTAGTAGVAAILTRTTDCDTDAEVISAYTYTGTEGSTNASKGYVQSAPSPTVGTDALVWNLFNSSTYGPGTGVRIASNLIYATLSEGVTGGQDAVGGTGANDTFTLKGSSSTANRTTTDPAFILKSMGPLADDDQAQVHLSIPVTVNQTSTAGYTGLKLAVTETGTGSGTKNLVELLAGASGTTSKFSVANTGTITVASGANRFANDVSAVTSDAAFPLVLAHNETWIRTGFSINRAITVPLDATTNFPIGAQINVAQWGVGTVTFSPESGSVFIRSKGGLLTIGTQYIWVTLKKVAANEWALIGDLT